jgi:nicotinamidase-related amidase
MHGWLGHDSVQSYYPGLVAVVMGALRVLYHLATYTTRTIPKDSRVTLVVLDAIEAYQSLFTRDQIERLTDVLQWAYARDARVVFTQWVRKRPCEDQVTDHVDKKGHWTMFVPHDQSELLVTPGTDGSCVQTRFADAFVHPDFVEAVGDATHIVLVGAWLESCVLHTARSAMARNMDVTVVRSACGGHTTCRPGALYTLQDMYATVVDDVE